MARDFCKGNLELLKLSDNSLNGTIPSSFGGLSRLIELEMGGNRLSGQVPVELGQLAALQIALNVSHNMLSGEIPTQQGICTCCSTCTWTAMSLKVKFLPHSVTFRAYWSATCLTTILSRFISIILFKQGSSSIEEALSQGEDNQHRLHCHCFGFIGAN